MILQFIAAALFGIVTWNVLRWRKVCRSAAARDSVTILIPARNEEHRLPDCLESLLTQRASEILIYDDHSEDGTALVIDRFAKRDARIRRIPPVPLPPGWCGKNFACAQLAKHATGEWLLFLDADVRLTPHGVARIAGEAERRSLTLLSCWPGFVMHGFWEAALMPMLNFLVFTLFPAPIAAIRNDVSLGIAHGACILARRSVYQRLGGHSLVRNEIFEDTRLAREWRGHGERSLCLDGQDVIHVRMYCGFGEIWQGFQKNFYPAFLHERNFWLFLGLHGSSFPASILARRSTRHRLHPRRARFARRALLSSPAATMVERTSPSCRGVGPHCNRPDVMVEVPRRKGRCLERQGGTRMRTAGLWVTV